MKRIVSALAVLGLLFACNGEKNPIQEEVLASAIKLNKNEIVLEKGANEILMVTYTPSNVTKKDLTWVSSDTGVATVTDGIVVGVGLGNTEIIVKCGEAIDKCKVTVLGVPKGAVDLGIVMTREDGTTYNLYWATSNLSEDGLCPNPEEYGDYYAWGETDPYYVKGHSRDSPCNDWRTIEGKTMTGYDWASYKWCNGSYNTLTKYVTDETYGTVDNKTVLEDLDDVAHVKLGGKWRMPTIEEWTELRTMCTWAWTIDYRGTGVSGRIVTSDVEGYEDKSIFLPAAGERIGVDLDDSYDYGAYWSSSLNIGTGMATFEDTARRVYFSKYSTIALNQKSRFYGASVRPVYEN